MTTTTKLLIGAAVITGGLVYAYKHTAAAPGPEPGPGLTPTEPLQCGIYGPATNEDGTVNLPMGWPVNWYEIKDEPWTQGKYNNPPVGLVRGTTYMAGAVEYNGAWISRWVHYIPGSGYYVCGRKVGDDIGSPETIGQSPGIPGLTYFPVKYFPDGPF